MRMIFSTVRLPHEPAFTVESLAITQTARPSIRPTPVTTPSAGRSGACAFAKTASSTNESASNSRAIRVRANSFFSAASFSWAAGAPPLRMRSSFPRTPAPSTGLVGIETALGLHPEVAGLDALGDLEARLVVRRAELAVQRVEDRPDHVEPHQVGQCERAHRVVAAELHALVDRLRVGHALLQRGGRLV